MTMGRYHHHRWFAFGIISMSILGSVDSWNINLQPKQLIDAESLGWTFGGSESHGSHFKLIESDGDSILLGGRNAIYNLSVTELQLQKVLEWPPTQQDVELCRIKGKLDDECQNYIRVLTKQSNGKILVCGTNAYKPMCRQYQLNEDDEYQMQREFSGFAVSPYDPRQNSTAYYVSEKDELYTGTVSDFTGSDPLIYRKPFSGSKNELRTPRNNMRCLNDPNFVSATDDSDSVYFFFRETAVEYANCAGANGGKATYSRVGRVCKNDQGGTRSYSDTWTSFTKARLNCSLPGVIPFYFDEIQSTAIVSESANGKGIAYGIFSTPFNGLQASAVCAFRLEDVKKTLTQSSFKVQSNPTAFWGPTGKNEAPSSRPGTCSGDSKSLTDDVLKFIQRNSLVDEAVPSLFSEPLLVHSDLRSQFTHIAVDPNVATVDSSKSYDVMFVGTDDGQVLKFVSIKTADYRSIRSVLIETIKVFKDGRPVNNLMVHRSAAMASSNSLDDHRDGGRLIVVSDGRVKALSLHNCQNRSTCGSCVGLQDPYCAWNVKLHSCVARSSGIWTDGPYKQSVEKGYESDCPGGGADDKVLFTFNDLSPQPVSNEKPIVFGTEVNMAVAVIITLTIAATLGFIIGYRFSRWRTSNLSPEYASTSSSSNSSSASGPPCYAPSKHLNTTPIDVYGGLNQDDPIVVGCNVVSSPISRYVKDEGEAANLVLSFARDDTDPYARIGKAENDRFLNTLNNNGTMATTTGQMPREYKVKKVYV